MKPALFLAAALALAGCQTATSPPPVAPLEIGTAITLSATQVAAVQTGVKQRLKDPASATFRDFKAVTDTKGLISVCGYVNAKNGFGGYTGDEPFTGAFAGERFIAVGIGGTDIETQATRGVCQQVGIYL